MKNSIYDIYNNEIDKIIKNENTESVFLVGSSKKMSLNNVNDIDIFVFVEKGDLQVREIKEIDGVEFDINYFSKDGLKKLIDDREYFFLKEMSDPQLVYDKKNNYMEIIKTCKKKFEEGPNKLSKEETIFIKNDIKSKIDRLKYKDQIGECEYEFLTNLYLKDIIMGYFSINKKWIPKDKKLFKELKLEDEKLYGLIKKIHINYKYEDLLNVYEYIFKNLEVRKNIKITY